MSEFNLQPCDGRHLIQKITDELLTSLAKVKQQSCDELATVFGEFGVEGVSPCNLVNNQFLRLISNNQTDEAVALLITLLNLPPHTIKLLTKGFDNLTPTEQSDVVEFIEASGVALPPHTAKILKVEGGLKNGISSLTEQERVEFNQFFSDRGTAFTVSFLAPIILAQVSQKIKCPTGNTLQTLTNIVRTIKRFVNSIATKLQLLSKIVNLTTAAINAISLTITALEKAALATEASTFASAATPSGASGVFALLTARINRLADRIKPDIQGPSNKFGETGLDGICCQAAKTITFVTIQVNVVQAIISIIDIFLQSCSKDQIDTGNFIPVQLSQSGDNNLGTYQGYRIEIRIDPNSPPVAPRRFAVAIDSIGVVVLEGNKSFSSSDQLLIEELKLAIDRLVI